jgi:hypothetical protein
MQWSRSLTAKNELSHIQIYMHAYLHKKLLFLKIILTSMNSIHKNPNKTQ